MYDKTSTNSVSFVDKLSGLKITSIDSSFAFSAVDLLSVETIISVKPPADFKLLIVISRSEISLYEIDSPFIGIIAKQVEKRFDFFLFSEGIRPEILLSI